LLSFVFFLLILIISFGVGAHLLRLVLPPPVAEKGRKPIAPYFTVAEEFVFATALGLGVVAYLVLALGLAKGLYTWALWILLAVLAAVGWRNTVRWFGEAQTGLRGLLKRRFSGVHVLMAISIGFVVLLCLISALAPTSGNDWDGLAYHLAVPKIYLQQHAIIALPWMSHSNFPFGTEMLYLLGLGLHGQALAKLFHYGFGFLLAMLVYCWATRSYGRGNGLIAAAVLASIPLLFWEATVPYNDLSLAFFAMLCIWAWWRKEERGARGWIMLSGIFAGLALGVKMLAGFLVIFILLAALWPRHKEDQSSETALSSTLSGLRAFGWWLLPTILVAAPWYVKSLIWTGNPVYPFFYGIFDGRWWNATLAADYASKQAVFGMGHGPQWLLALPWTLTMYSHNFLDSPTMLNRYNMFVAVIGPLFLAFLPLMLVRLRQDKLLRYLLAYSGVATVIWFYLTQQNRYLMPVLPALVLGIVAVLATLPKERHLLRNVIQVVIGFELVWGLVMCYWTTGSQLLAGLGLESKDEYLTQTLDIYPIAQQINATLPSGAKIMLFGETRGFYLDRNYLWGIGNNDLIHEPEDTADPQKLATAFRRLGVTHLLLAPASVQAMQEAQDPLNRSLRGLAAQGDVRQVLEARRFVVLSLEGK
jgi:4-amino-4-deoxy-L-arabinose transferase-like glycosyltransferase